MAEPIRVIINCFNSHELRKIRTAVIRIFILSILLVPGPLKLHAELVKTNNPGSWVDNNTWEGNSVPLSTDNAEIKHSVSIPSGTIVEIFDLTLNNILTVNGTLIIYGNLETGNNSELIANSGSSIFIFGDANLANKVSLDLSSYFVVKGNFTKSGASNQGDLSISGAHIYIFGVVDVPLDNNGIPWENFSVCSTGNYDGTTESTSDICDAGQLDDFIENVDSEELPDEIYDQLVGCDAPTATISGDATICEGESATINVNLTGTANWTLTFQLDGTNYLTVENISVSPYTFNVTQAGEYTVSSVSDANCTGTTSGSATITVNPTNTTTLSSGPGTDTQTVNIKTPITDITYTTTGATGANFSGLPEGISGNWAANEVTISGTPTEPGTFNYTVELTGGCGTVNATGTITVINTFDVSTQSPGQICNAADGQINYTESDVATPITFTVDMTTGNMAWSPNWEITFTLTPGPGATIDNITTSAGSFTTPGPYRITNIPSSNGQGSVDITLEVTGNIYSDLTVLFEITAAKELGYDTPDKDNDDWTATQTVLAIPNTGEITTN